MNSEKKNSLDTSCALYEKLKARFHEFSVEDYSGAGPSSGLFHKGSNLSSALLCGLRKSRLAVSLNLDLNGILGDV